MTAAGDGWAVHRAEALAWLTATGPLTVDAVVTDPPYSSGGQFRSDRTGDPSAKYRRSGAAPLPSFTGDNRDQRSFTLWSAFWLTEALRHTRPGGHLACFCDWRQLPALTDAVQAGGWVWRGVAVWAKPQHRSRPVKGGFWNSTEFIVWATNGPHQPPDDAPCLPGVIEGAAPAPGDRVHVTEKPLEVLAEVVRLVPAGGLVLDPFCGSGTTGVACLRSGRRFVGADIDPHWAAVASQRLANTDRGAALDDAPETLTLWETPQQDHRLETPT